MTTDLNDTRLDDVTEFYSYSSGHFFGVGKSIIAAGARRWPAEFALPSGVVICIDTSVTGSYGKAIFTAGFDYPSHQDFTGVELASEPSADSTSGASDTSGLEQSLQVLHSLAADFRGGEENGGVFGQAVRAFIDAFGAKGVVSLASFDSLKKLGVVPLVELLRVLSLVDSEETRPVRFWLLTKCLKDSSPAVRDGALVALLNLEDASAVPYLEVAAKDERVSELRREMLSGIAYLKA